MRITGQAIHEAYEAVKLEEKKAYAEVGIPTPVITRWEECSKQSRQLYEKMATLLNKKQEGVKV